MNYKIPFNKPFLVGRELDYIREAIESGKLSGNGIFTQRCHDFFNRRYGFRKNLLTTSCTDALEMSALLMDLSPEDEIILPSFTFVSTANAFALRGCRLRFADTLPGIPNIDPTSVAALITKNTRAIVIVHYAGMACDMDQLKHIAEQHKVAIIEDCAQAIDATYKGKPLGGFGDVASFSFHETKNIIAGEGGMLVVNRTELFPRAEILWEKGTNRSAFFRGEVDKYTWVDLGSSFLPSEMTAAFLFAQLENLDRIQEKRLAVWHRYHAALEPLAASGRILLPELPDYASNNAHMYYILCRDLGERDALIRYMKDQKVYLAFHYIPLHSSPFFLKDHDGQELPNTQKFSDRLVRLPLYFELTEQDQVTVINLIRKFYA